MQTSHPYNSEDCLPPLLRNVYRRMTENRRDCIRGVFGCFSLIFKPALCRVTVDGKLCGATASVGVMEPNMHIFEEINSYGLFLHSHRISFYKFHFIFTSQPPNL